MRADYHLHPNLLGKNPTPRLKALWKALGEHRLDAVICAEHTFKDAPGAYRMLAKAKPKNARTHVFPGAELVSNDAIGIDVIAFSDTDWYDEHPKLLQPYGMTLTEMLAYLETSGLQYFIPHPTQIGTPLSKKFRGAEAMSTFLGSVSAFEAFNGCNLLLEHLCSIPVVRPFLRTFRNSLRASTQLDLQKYQKPSHRFLAVGSDAHHPWEVGFSVEVPGTAKTRAAAFDLLTNNTNIETLYFPNFRHVLPRLIAMACTTLGEAWSRRELLRYRYQMEAFRESALLAAV